MQSHFAAQGGAYKSFYQLMTHTPLKVFVAGDEAVTIFFILSGFVITLPVLQKANFSWAAYYPARLIRLYVPTWAALAFASLLLVAIPRVTQIAPYFSWVEVASLRNFDPAELMTEAVLLTSRWHYPLNNVLWSIWWEVVFSLLLPVFILVALAARRYMKLSFFGCLLLITAGVLAGNDFLSNLPMFMLGVLIALHRERLRAWLGSRGRLFTALWFGTSLLLLIAWQMLELNNLANVTALLRSLQVVGATGIVLAVYLMPPAVRVFETRVPLFLGKISFSLYLIHVPVLVSLAYLFGPSTWFWPILLGLVLLVPLAYAFMRLVEAPATKLGRWSGARLATRLQTPVLRRPLQALGVNKPQA
jgi:peptidoglycan/LPS O-acetylase OafA/YrhL